MDEVKKFTCNCGSTVSKGAKYKHMESKIHFDNLIKKNEIKRKKELLKAHLETTIELLKLFEV